MRDWNFDDPPHTTVVVSKDVLDESAEVLFVYRDDDGSWLFASRWPMQPHSSALTTLETMVSRDPTIAALARLYEGWTAARSSLEVEWARCDRSWCEWVEDHWERPWQ